MYFVLMPIDSMYPIVENLLFVAVIAILVSWALYLRNIFDFKRFPEFDSTQEFSPTSHVTFCIPARNEAHNLQKHLPQFCATGAEVIVVDDESTDLTQKVLQDLKSQFSNLTIIHSAERPNGWLGKSWACQQAASNANTPWICFVDADVWCSDSFLKRFVRYFGNSSAPKNGLITIWPQQVLGSFWEVVVIPHVYVALLTFLPIRYQKRKPKWMPPGIYSRVVPEFAAANGQWMTFHKDTYHSIGGHESVRMQIVEDVELAKRVLRSGNPLTMYNGVKDVYCRMYQTPHQMWNGFKKNFFAGFGYNYPLFVLMGIYHAIVFLLPPLVLMIGVVIPLPLTMFSLAGIASFLAIMYRATVNIRQKWPLLSSPLHFIGVLWFEALAIQIIWNTVRGVPTEWKGRKIEL